jgi:hypothetical protein
VISTFEAATAVKHLENSMTGLSIQKIATRETTEPGTTLRATLSGPSKHTSFGMCIGWICDVLKSEEGSSGRIDMEVIVGFLRRNGKVFDETGSVQSRSRGNDTRDMCWKSNGAQTSMTWRFCILLIADSNVL